MQISRFSKTLAKLAAVFVISSGGVSQADFSNGGFEDPTDLNHWSVSTNLNTGIIGTIPTPADTLPFSQLNLQSGGNNLTSVLSASTETGLDAELGSAVTIRYPRYGGRASVVNFNGRNRNTNTLTQTETISSADIDPADGKAHVRFVILPVLESGGHPAHQQPYFFVQVDNVTKGTTLFHTFKYAAEAGVPWKVYNNPNTFSDFYYTDWQYIDIAPGAGELDIGDQIKLNVIAAGCSQSGHAGWLYVDGVGSFLPGLGVTASGPSAANDNTDITYTLTYRNGGTSTTANSKITQPVPANTTFVSVSAPGISCTTPSVGASSGNIECDVGSVAPNATGSIDVTFHIDPATTGTVSNGSYFIEATGVSPLIGPLVQTSVTSGVSYADLSVSITDGVAANGWGNSASYTVTFVNNGPSSADGATLTDTIPAQLTGATWSCAGSGGAVCGANSGSGNLNLAISTFPSGSTVTVVISGQIIAGSGSGTISHRVDVSTPGGVTDNYPASNTAVDTNDLGTLRTITLKKETAMGGTILSSPAAINCGTNCKSATATFVEGASVTLTHIAASPYSLVGWGTICAGSGNCTFTVSGDATILVDYTGGVIPVDPPVVAPQGQPTMDTTPLITGTGTPDETISVYIDDVLVGTTTVGTDGNWTFTPSTALSIGSHAVSATSTDLFGNVSSRSSVASYVVIGEVSPPVITPTSPEQPTRSNTPPINGTGTPGETIHVYVDDVLVGTTTVGTDGRWQFTLPTPLSIGSHQVTATSTDSYGNVSPRATIVSVVVVSDAVNDFNGDGSTDIAAWRKFSSNRIEYAVRSTKDTKWRKYHVEGSFVAPGDYNGDGRWDAAAVKVQGSKLRWNIPSGLSGKARGYDFGLKGDTIIAGCKLLSNARNSLAVFRERKRQILATELGSTSKVKGLVLGVKEANLLGCGDTDADGIDELIFQVPDTKSSHGVLVVNLNGLRKSYKNVEQFVRGLVIRRVGSEIPLVATMRSDATGKRIIKLMEVTGQVSYGALTLPANVEVAGGVFVQPGGIAEPAIFWADKSRQVYRQYITPGSKKTKLFSLPRELHLIRSENFFRSADFRN